METQQEAMTTPSLLDALATGTVGLLYRKRLWLFWWLGNLLAAALILTPLAALIQSRLGGSLAGRKLPSANDYGALLEIYRTNPNMPFAIIGLLAVVFVLYGFWSLCLLSGTLPLLRGAETGSAARPLETPSLGAMFKHAMVFWPRLFRLFLVSLLVYGAYFWAFGFLRRWLKGFVKGSTVEGPVAWVNWLSLGLLLAGFFLIKIFFDVVKIRMVVDDIKSAFKATWQTAKMCSFRLSRFVGIFVFTGLLSLLLMILYRGISKGASEQQLSGVFYIFCGQQLLLLGRIGVSLLYYSASIHWYESTKRDKESDQTKEADQKVSVQPYDLDPALWEPYMQQDLAQSTDTTDPKAAESASKDAEERLKQD